MPSRTWTWCSSSTGSTRSPCAPAPATLRGRTDWPLVGILAQRAKDRPNRIGVTTCALLAVDGLVLQVEGLDAVSGTPVLDVKPHMAGFGPGGTCGSRRGPSR